MTATLSRIIKMMNGSAPAFRFDRIREQPQGVGRDEDRGAFVEETGGAKLQAEQCGGNQDRDMPRL